MSGCFSWRTYVIGCPVFVIIPPLLNEEKIDAMESGDNPDAKTMSREMLEDICDSIQYHPNINRRESRYKLRDHINQIKL